jgi:amidase
VEQFVEQTLPAKYPRTVGHKPTAAENPLNGWSWRCEIKGADSGTLQGYTVAIKDAVCVSGIPMRNGSRILEGYIPDVDATLVTRILDAGGSYARKLVTT